MNVKAVATLTQAKGLIDTPEKWGKKAYSYNGKLCLMEAVMRSTKKDFKLVTECLSFLKEAWGEISFIKVLTSYNDTHTHEEVMRLFDDAIELASKQEIKVVEK